MIKATTAISRARNPRGTQEKSARNPRVTGQYETRGAFWEKVTEHAQIKELKIVIHKNRKPETREDIRHVMLDLFTIFSKGGIVLWCFQGTCQSFTLPVNELIRSVILQVSFKMTFVFLSTKKFRTCCNLVVLLF